MFNKLVLSSNKLVLSSSNIKFFSFFITDCIGLWGTPIPLFQVGVIPTVLKLACGGAVSFHKFLKCHPSFQTQCLSLWLLHIKDWTHFYSKDAWRILQLPLGRPWASAVDIGSWPAVSHLKVQIECITLSLTNILKNNNSDEIKLKKFSPHVMKRNEVRYEDICSDNRPWKWCCLHFQNRNRCRASIRGMHPRSLLNPESLTRSSVVQ